MKFQLHASGLGVAALLSLLTSPLTNVDAYSFTPQSSLSFGVKTSTSPYSTNYDLQTASSSTYHTHSSKHLSKQQTSSSASSKQNMIMMSTPEDKSFSLSSLFGNKASTPTPTSTPNNNFFTTTLDPHPSERPHISPLNILHPSCLKDPKIIQEIDATNEQLPSHPNIKSGVLPNGFSYLILPNKSPLGRFEAHLQVFSGSADELQCQQGIAHLTEHVVYMGSRKRERLFGTGSQTNAYTDFHHTVFYAACPTYTPRSNGNQPMLPMALDALCDVMEARVEPSRVEKERAAVLSEMTMVNTIEYRVECQILSTLHRENRLAKRFPIGKEELIRAWKADDVKTYQRTHYRPDNVLLYVVGDVEPEEVERVVEEKFGHLSAAKQGSEMRIEGLKGQASELADAVVGREDIVKSAQSWHYPPVKHDWCLPAGKVAGQKSLVVNEENELELEGDDDDGSGSAEEDKTDVNNYDIHLQESYEMDEKVDMLQSDELAPNKKIRPHIFRHELLQAFSLHLFAKRPVESITDLASFRYSLARRVALAALQIRLNVGGRSDDPDFTFVEFNQLDSSREGCAVCSLDLTSEPNRWRGAIKKALSEIRKLGVYGVTPGEMERYSSALMTDAEQLAAQGDRISNSDQLSYLMDTIGNGHTFMSAEQSYEVTAKALSTLTLEEVNKAAAELCSHVTSINDKEEAAEGIMIATACSPLGPDEDDDAYCDEESLVKTIYEACQIEVEPEEDVVVPHSLVPDDVLKEAMEAYPPEWLGGQFSDGTPGTPGDQLTRPFTLRRLGNGIRVGVARNEAESQRGHLRIVAPGGRDAEKRLGLKSGSMAVGSRTMQEGGAFGPWTREQVELFCVDHLLMVEINCNEESITFDFVFPTTNVGNVGFGENVKLGITGTEAVLQIVREIIVGFHWEEDALGRSKQSYRSAHEALQKNLEGKSTEVIMDAMTDHDERFLSVDVDTVNAVTLDDAKTAIMSQLQPKDMEISVAGDFNPQEVLDMIHKYVGTIDKDVNAKYVPEVKEVNEADFGRVPEMNPGRFLSLELTDSDPRAVSYVAGSAPNSWGYLADGSTVADLVMKADAKPSEFDTKRRKHPLFANVALSLISEIINRRLFSTVRERKQLTYDANFSLTGFERLMGGWFLVTVTASKEKAQAALEACKETLEALRTTSPVTMDNLESAKRVVLNRHEGELRESSYWTKLMSGLQDESVPLKGPLSVTDYHAVVESITTKDLQLTLECLGLDSEELYTAIGQTVQPEGYVPDDDIVKADPMAGMGRRGGALMG